MKLLLTGATGFVGSSFLDSVPTDVKVYCLGRRPPASKRNLHFLEVDISDSASVAEAANTVQDDFDALVHLAAYVPRIASEDNLAKAHAVNVEGTINLLEAFHGRFKKMVVGSTAEIYDLSKVSGKLTEDSLVGSATYYGATKLASELIAQTFGKKNDIPTIVLRFSVMYGPDDPIARALPNFIKAALANDPITVKGAHTLRDYIHVDDVVQSIWKAVAAPYSGVVNIGTGKGVSILDAANHVVMAAQSSSKVTVEESGKGVDVVIDASYAEKHLAFKAQTIFPAKLKEMVDSYRKG